MTQPITMPPESDAPIPAGAWWCDQFPTGKTTATLRMPWRKDAQRFIRDLESGRQTPRGGRCKVTINATDRPYLRALLMRRCWEIVKERKDPAKIPAHPALNIRWTAQGAAEMFRIYGLVAKPSLTSRHIRPEGATDPAVDGALAMDLTIRGWLGTRAQLDQFGRDRGVFPLAGDPAHWSVDGH